MESKIVKLIEAESRMVVARSGGNGEMGTKFQLCKMSKFWRCDVQHDYSYQSRIVYLKFTKCIDLKCFHHTYTHTQMVTSEVVGLLIHLIVVIISQCMPISNVKLYTLKIYNLYLRSLYLNEAGGRKKNTLFLNSFIFALSKYYFIVKCYHKHLHLNVFISLNFLNIF